MLAFRKGFCSLVRKNIHVLSHLTGAGMLVENGLAFLSVSSLNVGGK